MGSPKDKPRGYFEKLLVVDCETTGLCFREESPVYDPSTGERHQSLSWGIIVASALTLKPIEKTYIEIKWNEASKAQRQKNPRFGKEAEKVHGLTYTHLEEHGITEEEAIIEIAQIILKHFGPKNCIRLMGHNVHLFDRMFLKDLFDRYEIPLKFCNRHYDTNSAGFMTFGTWNSDELFDWCGFETRTNHNALDDALMTLESARIMRTIFQQAING